MKSENSSLVMRWTILFYLFFFFGASLFVSSEKVVLTETLSEKSFGGWQKIFSHQSEVTQSEMRFAIFLPPKKSTDQKFPVIYFLSGIEDNHISFIEKCDSQRYASEQGVIIVAPDSSPYNTSIKNERDSLNYGHNAGHYVDATEPPWNKHYKMHTYITTELRQIIAEKFPVISGKESIMGHSLGGYGALLLSIKHPGLYVSTSALAPLTDPTRASRSIEAFGVYFGKDQLKWNEWNLYRLLEKYNGTSLQFRIDQGTSDLLYPRILHVDEFLEACKKANNVLVCYYPRVEYDHHYYFVKTFIEEHIKYHMSHLTGRITGNECEPKNIRKY